MKKILVPCDFSRPSKEAFKFAVDIASKTDGEVIVLYVIYIPVIFDYTLTTGAPIPYDDTFITGIEDGAKKDYEEMKKNVSPKVNVSLNIANGDINVMIRKATEELAIDLVVMGTTGTSGLSEMVIGSNTEKVVRHSLVPVISLPTAIDLSSINNILLPTTLSLNQTDFITKVKELQDFFKATLQILLINTPANFSTDVESKELFEEFVKYYKMKDYQFHFRNYRNEEEGIAHFAYHEKVNLIAMGTHARKGLAHLFNGSITENVVNHIQCPVWTYHIK